MAENRCVCCGEIIPEGRMVCPMCERRAEQERDLAEELVSKWARGELVERKKGKWTRRGPSLFKCSECPRFSAARENFCPSCGADMREGKTDEAN